MCLLPAAGRGGSGRGPKATWPRAQPCCWYWARIPCYKHFLLRIILFGFRLEQEVLKRSGTASQREEKTGARGFGRDPEGIARPPPNQPCPSVQAGGTASQIPQQSHPPKCPAAALENCCSKVCFQHRNKQCEARLRSPETGPM